MKSSNWKFVFGLLMTATLLVGFRPSTVKAASPAAPVVVPLVQGVTLGVYRSEVLPSADSKGRQITLTVHDDGSIELATDNMNGKAPIVEVGKWHQSKKGNLVVDLTGTPAKAYNKPVEIVFKAEGDQLVTVGYDKKLYGKDGFTLTLSDTTGPAASTTTTDTVTSGQVSASADITATELMTGTATDTGSTKINPSDVLTDTGRISDTVSDVASSTLTFVSDILPSADTDGLQLTVALNDNGSATLSSDSMNGEDPVVEMGSWVASQKDQSQLTLTLTGTAESEYDNPVEMVFDVDQTQGTLTAVEYDTDLYGQDGFTLTLSENAGDQSQPQTGQTSVEQSVQPDVIAGVYSSELLPAADSPGLVITLYLMENGNAEQVSNYLNGDFPVVELGTWTDNGDDTVTATMSGTLEAGKNGSELKAYDTPSETTLDVLLDSLYMDNIFLFKLTQEDLSNGPDQSTSDATSNVDSTSTETPTIGSDTLVFASDALASAASPDMMVTLELDTDGTVYLTTDYADGQDPLIEVGDWQNDQQAGVVQVTITGTEDADYDQPIEMTFELHDNTLSALDYDKKLYGKDGLELVLQAN